MFSPHFLRNQTKKKINEQVFTHCIWEREIGSNAIQGENKNLDSHARKLTSSTSNEQPMKLTKQTKKKKKNRKARNLNQTNPKNWRIREIHPRTWRKSNRSQIHKGIPERDSRRGPKRRRGCPMGRRQLPLQSPCPKRRAPPTHSLTERKTHTDSQNNRDKRDISLLGCDTYASGWATTD